MNKHRLLSGIVLIVMVVTMAALVLGCAPAAPAKPAAPAAPAAPAPAPQAKTLKVALNIALNWPIGLDNQHAVELDVEKINSAGGLKLGSDTYKLQIVVDDNKMDNATGKAAAEKEIFQDGVKFIQSDSFSSSFISICDDNKVLLFSHPASLDDYNPKYHYLVRGGLTNTTFLAMIAYAQSKFPTLKTLVGTFPDRANGRTYGKIFTDIIAKNLGLQALEMQYYPPTNTDLSAVGTKIKSLNPDILVPFGGGPQTDSLVARAAYDAGWKGQVVGTSTMPGQTILAIAGAAPVEGMVCAAWPAEFDPALGPLAADFKARYTAKYGKWNDPETVQVSEWYTMIAALQQAGTTDVDKVAATVFNGMKFDSPNGSCMMIPRPDYNNPKTMDMVVNLPIKMMKGGKVVLFDQTTVDQQFGFVKKMYGF